MSVISFEKSDDILSSFISSTFSLSVMIPSLVIILILFSLPDSSFNTTWCSPSGALDFSPLSPITNTGSPTSNVGDSNFCPCASSAIVISSFLPDSTSTFTSVSSLSFDAIAMIVDSLSTVKTNPSLVV